MNSRYFIVAILLFLISGSYCLADSNENANAYQKCLASNYAGYFQQNTPVLLPVSNAEIDRTPPILKSKAKAIVLAVGPGLLIHGIGHAYAGDGLTFAVLIGCELVGGYYLVDGFNRAWDENSMDKLSDTETAFRASAIVILFFGSWVYDIMFSPGAVEKYNEELRARYNAYIKPDGTIGFLFSYRF